MRQLFPNPGDVDPGVLAADGYLFLRYRRQ
jgi:hypothetical protein